MRIRCLLLFGAAALGIAPWLQAQDAKPSRPENGASRKDRSRGPRPPEVSPQAPTKPVAPDSPVVEKVAPPTAKDADGPAEPKGSPAPAQATRRREPIKPQDRAIQFEFASAPWEHVLNWFSELCGLALQMDVKPPGTFNYVHDPRSYTIAEAMDVLNEDLIAKGHYLVRKGNFLKVIALDEDGVPPDLVPRIAPEQLDLRGNNEFVSVVFPVANILAETAAEELASLKGRYGKIVAMKSLGAVKVTDTAANVRLMRDSLLEIEGKGGRNTRVYQLKYAAARNVEANVRDLLGLPPRQTGASPQQQQSQRPRDPREEFRDRMTMFFGGGGGGPGGPPGFVMGGDRGDRGDRGRPSPDQAQPQATASVHTSVDDRSNQLLVSAPPDKLAQVDEIIKVLDVPREGEEQSTEPQVPVVKMHRLSDGDAQSLVTALQAIYQSQPSVRFSADSTNNAVIAVASPEEQKLIANLINDFENDERDLAVIPLNLLSATAVSDLLGALYASGQTDWRGRPMPRAGQPKVQADLSRNRVIVRGSKKQVEDIRGMLVQLGEYGATALTGNEKLRIIPVGGNSQQIIDQVRQVWRRPNAIQVIEPGQPPGGAGQTPGSGASRRAVPSGREMPADAADEPAEGRRPTGDGEAVPQIPGRDAAPKRTPDVEERPVPSDRDSGARTSATGRLILTGYQSEKPKATQKAEPAAKQRTPAAKPAAPAVTQPAPTQDTPTVVLYPGPNNLVVASDDPQALIEMTQLIEVLAQQAGGGADFTVIYLKVAEATQVAQQIEQVMGSTSSSSGGFPFGGFGGSSTSSTGLKIVPDTRTNALIVTGTPTDVERVKMLVEQVFDRNDAPASGALATPRLIPIEYSTASAIAQVIREVYANQISGSSRGSGGPGFPFGGFPPGGSSSRSASRSALSVSADDKSNTLIVSCSDALFAEIRQLVSMLDQAATQTESTLRVLTVRNAKPSDIQTALQGLQGISSRSGRSEDRSRDSSRFDPSRGGFPGGPPGGFPGGGPPIMIQPGGGFPGGFPGGGDRSRGFGGGGGPTFFRGSDGGGDRRR